MSSLNNEVLSVEGPTSEGNAFVGVIAVIAIVLLLGLIAYNVSFLGDTFNSATLQSKIVKAGEGQVALLAVVELDRRMNKEDVYQEISSMRMLSSKARATKDVEAQESLQSIEENLAEGVDMFPQTPMSISLTQVMSSSTLRYTGEVVANTFDFKNRYFVSNPIPKSECEIFNRGIAHLYDEGYGRKYSIPEPNKACVELDGEFRIAFKY
jgi:hypothetical protein